MAWFLTALVAAGFKLTVNDGNVPGVRSFIDVFSIYVVYVHSRLNICLLILVSRLYMLLNLRMNRHVTAPSVAPNKGRRARRLGVVVY